MNELSRYVRIYKFEQDALLYNTITGAVFIMPSDVIDDKRITQQQPSSFIDSLHKEKFFDSDINYNRLIKRYNCEDVLMISLELFLSCNLSCPYCYQINNTHYKGSISDTNINLLYSYIENVYNESHFKVLRFKILGGEPTVDWRQASKIISTLYDFCTKKGVFFNICVDTNGTKLREIMSITTYDSILLTIPLCEKQIHDKYRHYRNGEGTYDTIIHNIKNFISLPNSTIVIRHNTDNENIKFFSSFIRDLKIQLDDRLDQVHLIPQYTFDPSLGEYHNVLSHADFLYWKSNTCIDVLIENDFPIAFGPKKLMLGKCQSLSRYSLKIFSDGKVGACAVNFFDDNNPFLSDLMIMPSFDFSTYWNGIKNESVLNHPECLRCSSLFVCAGEYLLPCMKKLGYNACNPDFNLSVNLASFFEKLYYCHISGKGNLFKDIKIIEHEDHASVRK